MFVLASACGINDLDSGVKPQNDKSKSALNSPSPGNRPQNLSIPRGPGRGGRPGGRGSGIISPCGAMAPDLRRGDG